MTWTQQKQLVEMLSERASDKKRQARRARGNLKLWLGSSLGGLDTLAWTFAIGAWWAAGRRSGPKTTAIRRSVVAGFNAVWLAWQFINRQVKLVQPNVENAVEGQR
jgi:hypothetical protein